MRVTIAEDLRTLLRVRRPGGVPAGRAGSPTEGAGSPAERAGSPAERAGSPAEWAGRARVRRGVDVRIAGADQLRGLGCPVVFVANHASELDAELIRAAAPPALRPSGLTPHLAVSLRVSPVVFPEGGPTLDGTLGEFHPVALVAACRRGVRIVPVSLRGTFGLESAPRFSAALPPVVRLRFGRALPAQSDPRRAAELARAAVAALLSEDEHTWWEELVEPQAAVETGAGSWLTAWRELDPARQPGSNEQPRIWGE